MRSRIPCLFSLLGCLLLLGGVSAKIEASDAEIARRFERQGLRAFAEQQPAVFLDRMSAAVALRPDHPRLLYHLAIAQSVNGQAEAAVTTLGRLADLGVYLPAAEDADFAALRGREDFAAVLTQLESNLQPVGTGEIAFSVPGMSGLIEGVAWRERTGEFFFGDVHERCVWVRKADGTVERFTAAGEERLLGIFGLVVDEARGRLWAAMSIVPETRALENASNGVGLAALDLATGAVRRLYPRADPDDKEHVFGDLALAGDGTIYVTDSVAPIIWRLAPGGEALERWLEHDEFLSLQGIALTVDGRGLFVSAYGNGLLHVDRTTQQVRRLLAPANTTLLGCDGLIRTDAGNLIAIQNGVRPARVVRLTVDPTNSVVSELAVLAAGLAPMLDVALGCLAGDELIVIADAGWNRHGPQATVATGPRPVPVMKVATTNP